MDEAQARAFVDSLVLAGQRRQPVAVPGDFDRHCAPAQALLLHQWHVQRVLQQHGGEVIGIKLGGTTQAALEALGLGGPFVGPIFSALTHASPARLARSDFIACIVEAEVAVRLARDLEPSPEGPTREALLAAIDEVFPAIEIADSRLVDWPRACASAIVADLGYAGAWVRGRPMAQWRTLDLPALAVTLTKNGAPVRSGSGANVLGDPLHALTLAVAELGRQGRWLRAGDVVSLGSCTVPLPTADGGRFVADFGALGSVEVELV